MKGVKLALLPIPGILSTGADPGMKKRRGTLLLAGDSACPLRGLGACPPRNIVRFWPSEMDFKAPEV